MKIDKRAFTRAIAAAGAFGTVVYCHEVGMLKLSGDTMDKAKDFVINAAKDIGTEIINNNNVIDTNAEV